MKSAGDTWHEVRIGELGNVFTGRTPPTERIGYFGDAFPFITPGDMRQGKYVRVTERSLSHEGAGLLRRIELPLNAVCVSCIGWQMGEVIMTTKPSFTNQQINCIVPNGKIDPSFLYYSLRPRKQEFLSLGAATGVRTPILNKSAFCDLKIKVPRLAIQRRIAGILSAYDELIENNFRRIRSLEEMARSLYHEWFVYGKPSAQDIAGNPASELTIRWRTLGDICELSKEPYDEKAHSERPLVDLARIPRHSIAPSDTGKSNELTTSRIVFEPGDTLFGAIRCYLHKVITVHYPGVTNTSVFVLRPKKSAFRSLLALIASDAETIRWAETHSTGTKMPVINWGVFKGMPVPIPSDASAQRFERAAGPMLDQVGVLADQIQCLSHTRDLLLPRLLSGHLNVDARD